MSHKDGRVVLSAWVDPVLRDYAREAARLSGMEFSRWVERAVRQTMARESADRAMVAASDRELASRIRDIADHVLGIQPADMSLIDLLDALERNAGDLRVRLAAATRSSDPES